MNEKRFNEVYEELNLNLKRFVFRNIIINGTYQDAEEIVDNIFMEIWNRLDEIDDDCRGLLFVIAYRRSISFIRKANSKSNHNRLETPMNMDQIKYYSDKNIIKDSELLGDFTYHTRDRNDINVVLRTLYPTYAKAMRLHYLQGKSYEEIAKEMGVTTGYVNCMLDRGRLRFKNRLLRRYDYQKRFKKFNAQEFLEEEINNERRS